jgi:alcohol dehydrogenase (cytochrome c)
VTQECEVFLRRCLLLVAVLSLGLRPALGEQTTNESWPTYGYDLANTRHVDFPQINAKTVASLSLAWKFRTGEYGVSETTPLVIGDTMYLTTGTTDSVIALDARNGDMKWRYQPVVGKVPPMNRGVATGSGAIFFLTFDDLLVALDATTGAVRWTTRVAELAQGYREMMAPLAWGGLVIIGASSDEMHARGFVSAYSQTNGKLVWRWWSVSPGWEGSYVDSVNGLSLGRNIAIEKKNARKYARAWMHGGGAVWMTPALDPVRGALYAGVGNPSFSPNIQRPGDNLYTSSVVALNARSGKLLWYYQVVPHDVWDYDAGSPPVLFQTKDASGKVVDAVGEAAKTGWFYVFNRTNGKLIRISQPLVPQQGIFAVPTDSGTFSEPGGEGGPVAPVAYDPVTHLVFIQAKSGKFFRRASVEEGTAVGLTPEVLIGVDVDTGRVSWRKVISTGSTPNRLEGPLSAADLVFIGQEYGGAFDALSARDGHKLWSFQTDPGGETEPDLPHRTFLQYVHDVLSSIKHAVLREPPPPPSVSHIHASPIAYVVDGREYVAIAADAFFRNGRSPGDTLYVFALRR